jgi:hypothetical protein
MCKIAFFFVMCVAAICVAYCAKEERDCVTFTAWALAANWVLFVTPWIYAPVSPAFLAYDLGFPARTEDAWAAMDLICLVAVGWKTRDLWWSPYLWGAYLIVLAMHAVARFNGLIYEDYEAVLDAALVIQLAVIFSLGGGGCADRLSSSWHNVCDMGGASGSGASASVSAIEAPR